MPKVTIYDTKFRIGRGELPYSFKREGNPHWENFKDLMRFLGSIGFYVSEDKEIKKKFPSLSETNRAGTILLYQRARGTGCLDKRH